MFQSYSNFAISGGGVALEGSAINGAIPYDELSGLTLVSFLSMLIYYDKKDFFDKLFLAAHSCSFLKNGTMDVLYPNKDF